VSSSWGRILPFLREIWPGDYVTLIVRKDSRLSCPWRRRRAAQAEKSQLVWGFPFPWPSLGVSERDRLQCPVAGRRDLVVRHPSIFGSFVRSAR